MSVAVLISTGRQLPAVGPVLLMARAGSRPRKFVFPLFIAGRLNSRLRACADATILRPDDGFLFTRRELFLLIGCFAAIGFLFFININERNDGPVDLVVGCAVSADAE